MQRLQGEGRVADPRVAVVPVALTARGFRERGRERCHRRAGRHVGQPLDGQGGALDGLAPAVVGNAAPARASHASSASSLQSRRGVVDVDGNDERLRPRRARRTPCHPPRAACRARTRLPSMPRRKSVWSRIVCPRRRVGSVTAAVDQRPSRLCTAVIESGLANQLDLDAAIEALERAHQHVVGVVVGRRPRVRCDLVLVLERAHRQGRADENPARGGPPGRLDDVRTRLIRACSGVRDAERREVEDTGASIEQAAEHARRVEARDAQPVDCAVGRDERPGMAIGEERVIRDGRKRRRRRGALRRLVGRALRAYS